MIQIEEKLNEKIRSMSLCGTLMKGLALHEKQNELDRQIQQELGKNKAHKLSSQNIIYPNQFRP